MNVVGFEADAPADVHAIGLAGNASLAYESPDHLYLASSSPGWGWLLRCLRVPMGGFGIDDGTTMVSTSR